MFEIGDLVWYRGNWGMAGPVPALIVGHGVLGSLAILICRCRCPNAQVWGNLHQFESRACHLCGEPTAEPGCPLCPDCIEGQRERERDARAEAEQRRRPL